MWWEWEGTLAIVTARAAGGYMCLWRVGWDGVIVVMNSVEIRVGESHHGEMLGSYIRHFSASLDNFISESERDLVVLR